MMLHDPQDPRIYMPKTWERATRLLLVRGYQVKSKVALLRELHVDGSPDPIFARMARRAKKAQKANR